MRYNTDDDESDDLDERGCLRDGRRIVVPMSFADSRWIRDLRDRHPPMPDAFGFGHRPGFADTSLLDAEARDACKLAWEQRGAIMRDAWRQPPALHEMPSRSVLSGCLRGRQ